MKTIKTFRQIDGHPGRFEHYADEVQGQQTPARDDTVYVKEHGRFIATQARILCASCGRRRQACTCAPGATESLQMQRQRLVTAQAGVGTAFVQKIAWSLRIGVRKSLIPGFSYSRSVRQCFSDAN